MQWESVWWQLTKHRNSGVLPRFPHGRLDPVRIWACPHRHCSHIKQQLCWGKGSTQFNLSLSLKCPEHWQTLAEGGEVKYLWVRSKDSPHRKVWICLWSAKEVQVEQILFCKIQKFPRRFLKPVARGGLGIVQEAPASSSSLLCSSENHFYRSIHFVLHQNGLGYTNSQARDAGTTLNPNHFD